MWWLGFRATVARLKTLRMVSFWSNRASKRLEPSRVTTWCLAARDLAWRANCSTENNSARSGGSQLRRRGFVCLIVQACQRNDRLYKYHLLSERRRAGMKSPASGPRVNGDESLTFALVRCHLALRAGCGCNLGALAFSLHHAAFFAFRHLHALCTWLVASTRALAVGCYASDQAETQAQSHNHQCYLLHALSKRCREFATGRSLPA